MRQKMPSPPGYHSVIETYGALFENLRKFVSINITSNCARDKLQKTRQSFNESVHGYVKRFRHSLNELIYAMQHEIRDPIQRTVAIDLENERAAKTFILNLKPEIEIRTSSTKPRTLQEAQGAAFEAELLIGEIERNRGNQRSQQIRAHSFTRGNVSSQRNPPLRSGPMTTLNRLPTSTQINNVQPNRTHRKLLPKFSTSQPAKSSATAQLQYKHGECGTRRGNSTTRTSRDVIRVHATTGKLLSIGVRSGTEIKRYLIDTEMQE